MKEIPLKSHKVNCIEVRGIDYYELNVYFMQAGFFDLAMIY